MKLTRHLLLQMRSQKWRTSDELGISDEKDKYCCSTGRGGVGNRKLYEVGKHGDVLLLLLACSRNSLWTGRRGEISTQVLGSESLEGCGGEIAVAALQRISIAEAQLLSPERRHRKEEPLSWSRNAELVVRGTRGCVALAISHSSR